MSILALIQEYIYQLFNTDAPDYLVYHAIGHTRDVVARCGELANYYGINENDKTHLLIAAWFHDVGHLYTRPELHEEKSVEVMHSYLADKLPSEALAVIERLIVATKSSVEPGSLLEFIIRDADSFHFGTDQFFITDALVKKEMEKRTGSSYPNWNQHSIALLNSHRYYTTYCQQHLNTGKEQNIAALSTQS